MARKRKIGFFVIASFVAMAPARSLGKNPLEEIDRMLQDNVNLVVTGFDALQAPRYRIVYEATR